MQASGQSPNSEFCEMWNFVNSQRKTQQDATVYQNFIIPYLYEAQHVSGDTLPIIRNLRLHWQPLVLHT
jgi:hypothetical protein